jgi:hypothetical protein
MIGKELEGGIDGRCAWHKRNVIVALLFLHNCRYDDVVKVNERVDGMNVMRHPSCDPILGDQTHKAIGAVHWKLAEVVLPNQIENVYQGVGW